MTEAATTAEADDGPLRAPFPWMGGKSRAAHLIWPRLGDVANYVEPFAGSLAVLLRRPHAPGNEIVNDLDCYIANAWRAIAAAPEEVARWADSPVNEADLHARHRWLHAQAEFRERLRNDPHFYDATIAGWWCWGLSCWIGDNWCRPREQEALPHLTGGMVEDAAAVADCALPVNAIAPTAQTAGLLAWFNRLAARLRHTKVCCGDWTRVCTKAATYGNGLTGVMLDPPYEGYADSYGKIDCVSAAVRAWAIENGSNPLMRIALCGYDTEHGPHMPPDWTCVAWKAAGGYGNKKGREANVNATRERIWFSPYCLRPEGELDFGAEVMP